MERILLAIDAINPDKGALEFACYLGKLTKSKITGVFLENIVDRDQPASGTSHEKTDPDFHPESQPVGYVTKIDLIEKNILLFKERCVKEEAMHNVHRDRGMPAGEVIAESRFADVLVVDSETSFKKHYEGSPTEFVKTVLKKAECPVIIAPESFEEVDEIVFAYNNTPSSVFALKLFTYLFPQFHDKKITILQANETGYWQDPDKYHFTEWLKEHYIHSGFEAVKGDADTVLLDCLLKRKNIFLVMGAYGRNTVSTLFKHSSADLLIRTITAPIFIAHL